MLYLFSHICSYRQYSKYSQLTHTLQDTMSKRRKRADMVSRMQALLQEDYSLVSNTSNPNPLLTSEVKALSQMNTFKEIWHHQKSNVNAEDDDVSSPVEKVLMDALAAKTAKDKAQTLLLKIQARTLMDQQRRENQKRKRRQETTMGNRLQQVKEQAALETKSMRKQRRLHRLLKSTPVSETRKNELEYCVVCTKKWDDLIDEKITFYRGKRKYKEAASLRKKGLRSLATGLLTASFLFKADMEIFISNEAQVKVRACSSCVTMVRRHVKDKNMHFVLDERVRLFIHLYYYYDMYC